LSRAIALPGVERNCPDVRFVRARYVARHAARVPKRFPALRRPKAVAMPSTILKQTNRIILLTIILLSKRWCTIALDGVARSPARGSVNPKPAWSTRIGRIGSPPTPVQTAGYSGIPNHQPVTSQDRLAVLT